MRRQMLRKLTRVPRRRPRGRRVAIVAFVLTPGLLLGGGLWLASNALQPVFGFKPVGACVPDVVRAPLQNSFVVNVLNHGAGQGAAAKVAKQLPRRNFTVGQVTNDPSLTSVKGVGEVRYGPGGLDQALVVRKLLLPQADLARDYRLGTSVDLVLGGEFTQLAAPDRPMVRRAEVPVNVYNTTYYEGLAKKTAAHLTGLGFAKGKVGSDPKRTWVTDTAAVRYGPDGELGAKLVQAVVPESRLVRDASIRGTSVDLLIGMTWKGVLPKDKVAPEPPKRPLRPLMVERPCR